MEEGFPDLSFTHGRTSVYGRFAPVWFLVFGQVGVNFFCDADKQKNRPVHFKCFNELTKPSYCKLIVSAQITLRERLSL